MAGSGDMRSIWSDDLGMIITMVERVIAAKRLALAAGRIGKTHSHYGTISGKSRFDPRGDWVRELSYTTTIVPGAKQMGSPVLPKIPPSRGSHERQCSPVWCTRCQSAQCLADRGAPLTIPERSHMAQRFLVHLDHSEPPEREQVPWCSDSQADAARRRE
jgi:hypothetical protein